MKSCFKLVLASLLVQLSTLTAYADVENQNYLVLLGKENLSAFATVDALMQSKVIRLEDQNYARCDFIPSIFTTVKAADLPANFGLKPTQLSKVNGGIGLNLAVHYETAESHDACLAAANKYMARLAKHGFTVLPYEAVREPFPSVTGTN